MSAGPMPAGNWVSEGLRALRTSRAGFEWRVGMFVLEMVVGCFWM